MRPSAGDNHWDRNGEELEMGGRLSGSLEYKTDRHLPNVEAAGSSPSPALAVHQNVDETFMACATHMT